jgi:hypothetical protein
MGCVDRIGLAEDRDQVESSCECGNQPSVSIKCWKLSSGYTYGGLPSCAQLHRVS